MSENNTRYVYFISYLLINRNGTTGAGFADVSTYNPISELDALVEAAARLKEDSELPPDTKVSIINYQLLRVEDEQNTRANGWRRVEDGLPEEDGSYLVQCDNGKMRVAGWYKIPYTEGRCFHFPYAEHSHSSVVAWMPLPEAFEG
jgi:hypothetical protein